MRFMYRLVAITKSEFNSDTPLSCTFLHTDKWVPAPFWEKCGKEHRIRSPLQEMCPTKPSPAVCSVPNTSSLPLQIGTPGKVLKAETSGCSRRAGPRPPLSQGWRCGDAVDSWKQPLPHSSVSEERTPRPVPKTGTHTSPIHLHLPLPIKLQAGLSHSHSPHISFSSQLQPSFHEKKMSHERKDQHEEGETGLFSPPGPNLGIGGLSCIHLWQSVSVCLSSLLSSSGSHC